MPSITYWSRLEPRPRAPSIAQSLSARIRDPLWMLTRQWQFGEFQGEDAGSPAFARISTRLSPMVGWRVKGQPMEPLRGDAPMERSVETEPLSPDLSVRVELGQTFEALLAQAAAQQLIQAFRLAYPVEPEPETGPDGSPDQETARFRMVCAGRAIDGVALYQAAEASRPSLPPAPAIDTSHQVAVRTALENFRAWVQEVFGHLGFEDPPAWTPERLEYSAEAVAVSPVGVSAVFSAHPGREGEFDWHAFDLQPTATAEADLPGDSVRTTTRSVLPAHVRFRGMPNARWWDFERGSTDFGSIEPDIRDLAKLMVMDFMLVHGDDWFVIPFEQPVGTLCRIDSLVIHDVFGGRTVVERADAAGTGPGQRWTMFSTTIDGDPGGLADFFLLPPSASAAMQTGQTLEEIRFMRDEMANMVWAIEHTTENGIGQPWPGHERALASRAVTPATPPPPSGPGTPHAPSLRYQIQTTVPDHWIPFLPVSLDPMRGEIALERAAMLRATAGGPPEPILPVGRILQPGRIDGTAYRVREEEVPRSGIRVMRVVCRSRWTDGSTHLWVARRKTAGAGEGASGLRFDVAMTAQ